MQPFAVITNRKRALIILIHSAVFFLLALSGVGASRPGLLHGPASARVGGILFAVMYFAITTVLLILLGVSRHTLERAYFALCSASAGVAFLRALFGEFPHHASQVVRVVMLGTATVIISYITQMYSRRQQANPPESSVTN